MSDRKPHRGDIWFADFSPVRGHEQGGVRPALVISLDLLNLGPSELVALIPLTTRDRRVPAHVPIAPPEGGIARPSFILCDQLRFLSQERLQRHSGVATPATLDQVENWLRVFLGL